ncbi:hypothetical protein [Devosia alba]|uniref:hypothetical protein n=1 Tax=Devosia alba TaxID=3152360 RepID=UPI003267973F
MTAKKDDLDHRISDAFATKQSSTELSALLQEVRDGATAAVAVQAEADRVALDPATRPEAVREAREASGDATFRAARFTKAVEGLEALLTQAKGREADEARQLEHAAAIKERDQLADDLKEFWQLTNKMVGLLTRLSRNNKRLGGDHRHAGPNRSAESILRGVEHLSHQQPSIVDSTKLLGPDGRHVWPPHNTSGWTEYP